MPASRRGTRDTSTSMPLPPFAAASTLALVSPAAPRSCIPTYRSVAASSRHASMSDFSRKGLPTCTVGRSSLSSSNDLDARPDAP